MSINRFFLDNLWRWKCGLPELDNQFKPISIENLEKTQWSPDFEQLMRNRLIMGSIRYGWQLGEKGKPQFDRIESIKKRLDKYKNTGNTEFLVDIANLCLLEFVEGNHPNKHFSSIDDGEHVNLADEKLRK